MSDAISCLAQAEASTMPIGRAIWTGKRTNPDGQRRSRQEVIKPLYGIFTLQRRSGYKYKTPLGLASVGKSAQNGCIICMFIVNCES